MAYTIKTTDSTSIIDSLSINTISNGRYSVIFEECKDSEETLLSSIPAKDAMMLLADNSQLERLLIKEAGKLSYEQVSKVNKKLADKYRILFNK